MPFLELGHAEQVMEIGVARKARERLAHSARRAAAVAALHSRVEILHHRLHTGLVELERLTELASRALPIGVLETLESATEQSRLLDFELVAQPAQRVERLAQQAFARVEQRQLHARRH